MARVARFSRFFCSPPGWYGTIFGPALPVGFPVTARRVVRGGSWNNNRTNARAAYRNFNAPDNRNNNIGFRVVCASHTFNSFNGAGYACCEPTYRLRLDLAVLLGLVADSGLRPEAKG
ncbi:MAG: SUMF1/EgtB/PvdO family nonheme iron enzyme [Gammaproteobacteria bacterium]|nr:SUMF1/EgtB/PvdO family nonheme iron enzyme [Gammaproteobacteria bacterium]